MNNKDYFGISGITSAFNKNNIMIIGDGHSHDRPI